MIDSEENTEFPMHSIVFQVLHGDMEQQAQFARQKGFEVAMTYFTPQYCRCASSLMLAAASCGDSSDMGMHRVRLPPFVIHRLIQLAVKEGGSPVASGMNCMWDGVCFTLVAGW